MHMYEMTLRKIHINKCLIHARTHHVHTITYNMIVQLYILKKREKAHKKKTKTTFKSITVCINEKIYFMMMMIMKSASRTFIFHHIAVC